MSFLSSCFGLGKNDSDTEPLLPQYNDDTTLQRRLHEKLHTYQQFRALSKGFMPDTEQTIINLRTLLASDFFSEDNPDLSESGRRLVKYTKQWLQQFIELLRNKNDSDQIQDLVWFLSKSRISVDTDDIARRAKQSKARADTLAAFQSLKTVGSLVLLNDEFRTFLADLNVVGREIFKDTAFKLSETAEKAGEALDPSEQQKQLVAKPGDDKQLGVPSAEDLGGEVAEVTQIIANGTAEVTKTAAESATERLQGDEGKTLINRLKQAILSLRERKDYSQSVSTLSLLIQRYAFVYSRAAADVSQVAAEDTQQNEALDRAVKNAWSFLTTFGDEEEWRKAEQCVHQVMSHRDADPKFEEMMGEVGESVQKMLTDPAFLDEVPEKIDELKEKGKEVGKETGLHEDIQNLLRQLERTFKSVLHDKDINALLQTSHRLLNVLSPANQAANTDLLTDGINVFLPHLLNLIQHLPIPRLEVSTPAVDILLENLILEPGSTINRTSFLPYHLKVETYNDLSIHRTQTLRTATATKHLVTIKIDGLSLRAEEVGFVMHTHTGLLRLADEGILSFALDERGMDIHIDVEICKERLEQILTLKAVRVHVHRLNYTLRKSKFSWLAFLLKPLLRPILRKTMESQVASSLADAFHAANREILYARERLRATRIADPKDLMTFVKAVAARLTPEDDPEVFSRVGVVAPGKGRFKGVYAPGSLVKVWEEEGARATERIEDNEFDVGGWRNGIFDMHVANMG